MRASRRAERARLVGSVLAAAALLAATIHTAPARAAMAAAESHPISTYAGGPGQGVATNTGITPGWIATVGNAVYVADDGNAVIRTLDLATGQTRVVAGNGSFWGSTGDGGPATSAAITPPLALAAAADGTLYIAETSRHRVRRVSPSGIITMFVGTGNAGYGGDGGPALDADLKEPGSLAVDPAGSLLIGDSGNNRVRKVDTAGRITTLAGTGVAGDSSDLGPAVLTQLSSPQGIAAAPDGTVFIADRGNRKIRKVDTLGIMSTLAGVTGTSTVPDGDGGPATSAHLYDAVGVALRGANVLFSDYGRLRQVDAAGTITTVVDSRYLGPHGFVGLSLLPAVTANGTVLVADRFQNYVSRVDGTSLTVVAGNGLIGRGGDGGQATWAQLNQPSAVAVDREGNVYLADDGDHRVVKVSTNGTVTTIAGTGEPGYSGDGGPGRAAALSWPAALAVDAAGNVYIGDHGNYRVRRVDRAGTITTVAGGAAWKPWQEGALARDARIGEPNALALDQQGNLYIGVPAAVLKVDPSGVISTFAGNNAQGTGGDGGPATAASVYNPFGLAVDDTGNVFVSDIDGKSVRKIDTSGTITRVAGTAYGTGVPGSTKALETALVNPRGVAVDGDGNVYVADGKVFKVDESGIISVVAGGGQTVIGDGGPATATWLRAMGVAFDTGGNLYIADSVTGRIRRADGLGRQTAARSFGWNGFGALGTGDLSGRSTPAPAGGLPDTRAVGAGAYHSLAVNGDGTVRAWGYNAYGELGTGGTADSSWPVAVPGLTGVTSVKGGGLHSVALGTDGTVRGWGWNALGQLGDGSTTDRLRPAQVPGLTGVTAIAAGGFHALAVRQDGTVWAWGWNVTGQLGDGTLTNRALPTKVVGLDHVVAVAAGVYHSLALKDDGTVWAWGWNAYGQLGEGPTTYSPVPVRLRSLPPVGSIAAGAYHSLAATRGGAVFAWGWNGLGQLGDGTTVDRSLPVPVLGLSDIAAVATGWYHSIAVRRSGTAMTWGWNTYGQLGDGTTVDRRSPVTPVGLGSTTSIVGGGIHTVAVTARP